MILVISQFSFPTSTAANTVTNPEAHASGAHLALNFSL